MVATNVTNSIKNETYFNIAEFCLFSMVFGAFVTIVVHFLFISKSCRNISGFLYGGRNMSVFSVTLGLIASHITGITLLGIPLEIYMRGTQYWASALSIIVVSILTAFIYLPVFHKLQLSSSFEYLEIRFSTHTRTIAAMLFVVSKLMLLPVVPYIPLQAIRAEKISPFDRIAALVCVSCATLHAICGLRAIIAASVVTVFIACVTSALPSVLAFIPMGLKQMRELVIYVAEKISPFDRIAALVCVSCATLHAICGLRAIIAASVVTVFIACVASALPSVLALIPVGLKQMWEIADRGDRIVFYESDPDLEHHTSFLAVTLAMGSNWLWKTAISQASIQKLLALPDINKARICLALSCVGIIFMKILSCFMGLAMYAWFAGCDPILSGQIRKHEQLVPYFLQNLSAFFPGIGGIFLTAIFSATTCCMSSIINSISGVIFEDFLRPWIPMSGNESFCCRVMKVLCLLFGLYCGIVIWFAPELDRLLHVATGVTSVTAGTLLGLFTLGIVSSRANCAGALSGAMVSVLLCGWLLVEAEKSFPASKLFFQKKPLSTINCTVRPHIVHAAANITSKLSSVNGSTSPGKLQTLLRISLTYCTFAGAITVLLIGVPMSYLTKSRTASMNPDIFCPLTQSFMNTRRVRRKSIEENQDNDDNVYLALDEALKQLKEAIDK